MEYKLAQVDVESEVKKVTLKEIEEISNTDKTSIIYFDRTNTGKSLKLLVKHFDKQDKNVYIREVKFGLDENDYLYEVHIL
jgi:hypothetical protein